MASTLHSAPEVITLAGAGPVHPPGRNAQPAAAAEGDLKPGAQGSCRGVGQRPGGAAFGVRKDGGGV